MGAPDTSSELDRRTSLTPFAITILVAVGLLMMGALFGGIWAVFAWAYLAIGMAVGDQWMDKERVYFDGSVEFPAGNQLLVVLALVHFGLMALALWALLIADHGTLDKVVLFVGFWLYFGQVSNPVGHELIHRDQRGLFLLGRWVFISLLFGHHCSAHPKVHHRFVATDHDPNSARLGESVYRFLPRAWIGSFRAGWLAENALRIRRAVAPSALSHPYFSYVGGGFAIIAAVWIWLGLGGAVIYVGLAFAAQFQVLLSDYVQHYGLRRATLANGKYVPVGSAHSWNAPHWLSSRLMLHAPRHSDHHVNPSRAYPGLRLSRNMPTLPRSLPMMGIIALWPSRWFRIMDERARRWNTSALGPDRGI